MTTSTVLIIVLFGLALFPGGGIFRLYLPYAFSRHNLIELNKLSSINRIQLIHEIHVRIFQIELFHDQLPLAVPCYDLLPVDELTVGPH